MSYVPVPVVAAQWKTVRNVNFVATVSIKKRQRLIFGMSTYTMLAKPIGNTHLSQANCH